MKRCNQKEVNLSKEFLSGIFLEIPNDFRSLQENGRSKLVGVERITTHPHTEPFSKITSHNIINLQNTQLLHTERIYLYSGTKTGTNRIVFLYNLLI